MQFISHFLWHKLCGHHSGRPHLIAPCRNVWLGDERTFFRRMKVLLNFYNFCMRRKYKYEPVGPWDMVPAQPATLTQDLTKEKATQGNRIQCVFIKMTNN